MLPNWATLYQELKKPGVTLTLLWQEYRAQHPHGYAYSQFCERYRQWARRLTPSMRQVHRAGEKLFVDFSGKRPHLIEPTSGEEVAVELFVGVLGASGLIYAETTRRQDLAVVGRRPHPDARVLSGQYRPVGAGPADERRHHGQVATNRRSTAPRVAAELARLYGAVVIPARPATPTDKPLVEVSVQIAQCWVAAALRHRTFFTLADLNAAIGERIDATNDRPMKRLGVSRRTLFDQIDPPALKPLPATRYELAEWKGCRVNIDYHVEVAHNFYSVPYQLVHEHVEARFTASTVEVFFKNRPVAAHVRLTGRGRYATQVVHMPRAHRAHAEWTPSRLIAWAEQTGPPRAGSSPASWNGGRTPNRGTARVWD